MQPQQQQQLLLVVQALILLLVHMLGFTEEQEAVQPAVFLHLALQPLLPVVVDVVVFSVQWMLQPLQPQQQPVSLHLLQKSCPQHGVQVVWPSWVVLLLQCLVHVSCCTTCPRM